MGVDAGGAEHAVDAARPGSDQRVGADVGVARLAAQRVEAGRGDEGAIGGPGDGAVGRGVGLEDVDLHARAAGAARGVGGGEGDHVGACREEGLAERDAASRHALGRDRAVVRAVPGDDQVDRVVVELHRGRLGPDRVEHHLGDADGLGGIGDLEVDGSRAASAELDLARGEAVLPDGDVGAHGLAAQ